MLYDPEETKRIAEELQKRAIGAPIYFAWYGIAIGALALGFCMPYRMVFFSVCGGIAGGLLGYRIGQAHALNLRAKAQSLLCQMKIEETTRGKN